MLRNVSTYTEVISREGGLKACYFLFRPLSKTYFYVNNLLFIHFVLANLGKFIAFLS